MRINVFCILIFCCVFFCYGNHIHFKHINVKDGLSQITVLSIYPLIPQHFDLTLFISS